jgi:hypothetical protein
MRCNCTHFGQGFGMGEIEFFQTGSRESPIVNGDQVIGKAKCA